MKAASGQCMALYELQKTVCMWFGKTCTVQSVMQCVTVHELAAASIAGVHQTRTVVEAAHRQTGLFIWAHCSQKGCHSSDSNVSCHVHGAAKDA